MKNFESISIGIIILLIAFKPSFLKLLYKDNLGKVFLFLLFIFATFISRTIGISMAVLLLSLNVGGVSEGFLTEDEEEEEKIKQKQLEELKAVKAARKAAETLPVPTSQDAPVVDVLTTELPTQVVDPNAPVPAPATTPAAVPASVPATVTKIEGFTSNSLTSEQKIQELRDTKCKSGQLIGNDGNPIIFDTQMKSYKETQLKNNYPNIVFNDKQCNVCKSNCSFEIDNWNPSEDDINKSKEYLKDKCKSQGTGRGFKYLTNKTGQQIKIDDPIPVSDPTAKYLLQAYPAIKFRNENSVCNPCRYNCDFMIIDSKERLTNEEAMRPQPSSQTSVQ